MKRLLIVATGVDLLGGAEKHIVQIARCLSRKWDIEILAPRFLDAPLREERHGFLITRMPIKGSYARYLSVAAGAAKIDAKPLAKPPAIAHAAFLRRYLSAMSREVRRRDVDVVHAHTMLLPALAASRSKAPYVVTLHGGEMNRVAREQRVLRPIYRRVLRRARAVIAVSRELEEQALAIGADRGTLTYVPNGVDLAQWHFTAPRAVPPFTIVSNRRLDRKNGFDILLDAAAQLRERGRDGLKFLIIGRGPEEAALRAQASELGLTNVTFAGFLDEAVMAEAIRSADLAVLPSRMEGLPLALLEAMATGKPVVVTRIGGMPDVVNGNGLVVEPESPTALADGIDEVLREPHLLAARGQRSREIVESEYTWEKVAERTSEVLERACQR